MAVVAVEPEHPEPRALARAFPAFKDDATYTEDWRPPSLPYNIPARLRIPTPRPTGTNELTLTESLIRRIEQLIIEGASPESAKATCDITPRVWRDWKAKAKAGLSPYTLAFERIAKARAYVIVSAGRIIRAVSEVPDPKTAMAGAIKVLEHADPARFGTQRKELTVRGGIQVDSRAVVALAALDRAQIDALVAGLRGSIEAGERLLVEAVPTVPTPEEEE